MSGAQPSEADIHAAGLGLMLFSPSVFADIPDGADFMADLDIEPKGRRYDQLVLTQRVVLLGTGSPEIDYRIRVVLPPEAAVGEPLGATEFGLFVEGGVLAIRDGYEPMRWSVQDLYEIRFPVPDGYYRVRALWVPRRDGSNADMHIDLVLEPTSERVPGDGWPALMYDGSLEPPSPTERLGSEIALKVQAAVDAIPAALRRALDELGAAHRVEVVEILEGDDDPVEPPAIAIRYIATLTLVVDGCEIGVVAHTALDPGDPLWVQIQSASIEAAEVAVLVAAADTFERALATIGPVVERSTNF